jgi:hypothetical protein
MLALLAASLCILGYHPHAEDGGIYAAALEQRLQPELFPKSHAFVSAHMARSGFVFVVALVAKTTRVPLGILLAVLHVFCVAGVLLAGDRIARSCFLNRSAQRAAVMVLALGLSLPVAGTALYLCDPYVTARSFSTALLLWTLAALLRERWLWAVAAYVTSALVHPVMAVWGGLLLLAFLAARKKNAARLLAWLAGATVTGAAAVYALSPREDALVHTLAQSRNYWFITRWEWYEVVGAVVPPLLLYLLFRRGSLPGKTLSDRGHAVLRAYLVVIGVALVVALLFVRPEMGHLLLARSQPLRSLHLAYAVFLIFLGGWMGERVLLVVPWRWIAAAACIALPLYAAQRSLYPASLHLEIPGRAPRNGWVRAFVWARENTPQDALFALDAHYITLEGEDAQYFRSVSERSSLPDYSKDGGIASVSPWLGEAWQEGVAAQLSLDILSDSARLRRLQPLHVDWIILPQRATTSFSCPYENDVVRVCQLPLAED